MIEVMKIEQIASSAVAEWFLSTSRQDSCYFWSEIYVLYYLLESILTQKSPVLDDFHVLLHDV